MIDLNVLNYKDKIIIDENMLIPKNYYENSEVLDIDKVHVMGYITMMDDGNYNYNFQISGKIFLKDSITLEKVAYPINFEIEDSINENLLNKQNLLDINELLWENIVLEVPISYTESENLNMTGENWCVISGKKEDIDPRMQKLYDIYKGGE